MLKSFGVEVDFTNELTIKVKGNQQYSPIEDIAEGDFSQMAFFAVPAAIKGSIRIGGMAEKSLQGDSVILDILKKGGSDISYRNGFFEASAKKLSFGTVDISDCPDLGPILTVLLSLSGGGKITGAARLRIKESDRIAAMEENLKKLGVCISSTEDTITVGKRKTQKDEAVLSSFNDHRIAMSLAIFAALGENAVIIENAEAVSKSYPDFWSDLEKLRVKVEYIC